jgi:hypothetical protein
VVALLQLIFNHIGFAVTAFSYQVDAEEACSLLSFGRNQLKIEGLVEDVDVLLQPLGEVVCLMAPDLTKMNALELSD